MLRFQRDTFKVFIVKSTLNKYQTKSSSPNDAVQLEAIINSQLIYANIMRAHTCTVGPTNVYTR